MSKFNRFPWYLPVFSMYPAAYIWGKNSKEIPVEHLLTFLLLCSLGPTILGTALNLALRNFQKSAALACLWSGFFLLYGHFYHMLQGFDFASRLWRHRYLMPVSLLLVMGCSHWLIRRRRLANVSPTLNFVAVLLLLMAVLPAIQSRPSVDTQRVQVERGASPGQFKGDVVFVVLDEFPREDVFLDNFGVSLAGFSRELKELGFCVASDSFANYSRTIPSLASALNMRYLETPIGAILDQSHYDEWLSLIHKNEVVSEFKKLGYRVEVLTNCAATERIEQADRYVRSTVWNGELALSLKKGSILSAVHSFLGDGRPEGDIEHRQKTEELLYQLKNLKPSAPTFYLVHILSPHAPFVFRSNGAWISAKELGGRDQRGEPTLDAYRRWYPEQVQFVAKEIVTAIGQLISNYSNEETPPVILIVSDHGPQSHFMRDPKGEWSKPSRVALQERMPNLIAVRAAGLKQEAVDGLSLVNLFSLIFSHCFQIKKPLHQNRTFFIGEKILEVSKEVGK